MEKQEIFSFIQELAQASGQIIRKYFRTSDSNVGKKAELIWLFSTHSREDSTRVSDSTADESNRISRSPNHARFDIHPNRNFADRRQGAICLYMLSHIQVVLMILLLWFHSVTIPCHCWEKIHLLLLFEHNFFLLVVPTATESRLDYRYRTGLAVCPDQPFCSYLVFLWSDVPRGSSHRIPYHLRIVTRSLGVFVKKFS